MAKNVAVIVVNPVNGLGVIQLFRILLWKMKFRTKTFAVAEINQVKTNSGISIETDDVNCKPKK